MLKPLKNQASKIKNHTLYPVILIFVLLQSCQTTQPNISTASSNDEIKKLKSQKGLKNDTPKSLINGLDDDSDSSQSQTTKKITSFDQLDNSDQALTYADAENANKLNQLTATPMIQNGWHKSFNRALTEARRQQKPLFIWCTNSNSSLSPNSVKLYDDLIKQLDFNQWVIKNFVALKIDKQIQESNNAVYSKKQKHINQLLHQLDVRTFPTLLIYTPNSNLIGKHKYININPNYLWAELRRNLKLATQAIQKDQKQVMHKGFRFWNLNNLDYPLFARMTLYQVGSITLETPYKEKFTISTNSLSDEDYNWLQLQRVKSQ